MAKLGEDRYYKRSGDRFYRMEHFDLADMFGRRRRPALKLILEKKRNGSQLAMSIKNEGRGLAKAPYLSLTLPQKFRVHGYAFESSSRVGLRQLPYGDDRCHFGADANDVIHSGQTRRVAELEVTAQKPDGTPILSGPQTFRYELAAEDMELTSGEVVVGY
jgi:hypothetical protein